MTDQQVKDDADAAVDEQLCMLDDAERLFMAISAVAVGELANRASENLKNIREQRDLMLKFRGLFDAASEVGF